MAVLPYDMLVKIFNRLPVKSVCRLKTISKYMKEVIEDSDSLKSSRPTFFTGLMVYHEWKILSFYTVERSGISRRKFTTEKFINELKIANGLICFRIDSVDGETRILNPSLGKSVRIECSLGQFFELGYNSLTKSYKFLKWDKNFEFKVADLPTLQENCDCTWRSIENGENIRFYPTYCMNLDHRLVWYCSGDLRLTVFSLDEERFSHILLPPAVSPDEKKFLMFQTDGNVSVSERGSDELWFLKTNDWLKIILGFEFPHNLFTVYSEHGEIMLIEFTEELKLLLGHYSFVTRTLCYTKLIGDMEDIGFSTYVEGYGKNDIDLI